MATCVYPLQRVQTNLSARLSDFPGVLMFSVPCSRSTTMMNNLSVQKLIASAIVRSFAPGQLIVRPHEQARSVPLVLQGAIKVYFSPANADDNLSFTILKPISTVSYPCSQPSIEHQPASMVLRRRPAPSPLFQPSISSQQLRPITFSSSSFCVSITNEWRRF